MKIEFKTEYQIIASRNDTELNFCYVKSRYGF